VQNADARARGTRLVGLPRRFEHALGVERSKRVQALEVLRTGKQRTGVVFRLDVAVAHGGHRNNRGDLRQLVAGCRAHGPMRQHGRGGGSSRKQHRTHQKRSAFEIVRHGSSSQGRAKSKSLEVR